MGEAAYADETRAIQARDMDFHWDDVPLHYIPGQVVATHIYNCMHLLLPEGEKAMSKALADALPLIDDPRLREEVSGFIGQEATHADNHGGMLERLIELGLDPTPVLSRLERLLEIVMSDSGSAAVRHQLLCERLALFSALEHFTAVWGKFFLESDGLARSGIHPMVLDLLRWHGAEEVEHRSVVFDAFMHVDGGYLRRARMSVLGSLSLSLTAFLTLGYLIAKDPELRRRTRNPVRRWAGAAGELVRATRGRVVPSMLGFLSEIPVYLRRDFHPSELGGTELAVRYLAEAPIKRHSA